MESIKEIALKLLAKEFPGMRQENQTFMVEFAEALIESYKAELLKEVGEPFGHIGKDILGRWNLCLAGQGWKDETAIYTADQLIAATKPLKDQLAAAREEVERLKGIKNVQLDIYPNDAGTKQQREVDGSLEMGQLLADSKNEETSNPKAERAKSLVWMHTGGGHIADSSGKRIGIFSGDFKHRDRLICAVNSESDLLAQLAAAQEEIESNKAYFTTLLEEQRVLLAKAEQLWQVAQGRCDGLEEKLAKAEQRVAEACAAYVLDDLDGFEDGDCIAEAIRSGDWRKFVKEEGVS